MHLELSKQSPGFEVDIILLPKDDVDQIGFFEKMIFGQENLTRKYLFLILRM